MPAEVGDRSYLSLGPSKIEEEKVLRFRFINPFKGVSLAEKKMRLCNFTTFIGQL